MKELFEFNQIVVSDLLSFKENVLAHIFQINNILKEYRLYCKVIIKFTKEVSDHLEREFSLSSDDKLIILDNHNDYVNIVEKYNKFYENNLNHFLRKIYNATRNYISTLEGELEKVACTSFSEHVDNKLLICDKDDIQNTIYPSFYVSYYDELK